MARLKQYYSFICSCVVVTVLAKNDCVKRVKYVLEHALIVGENHSKIKYFAQKLKERIRDLPLTQPTENKQIFLYCIS